jgi:hypothetical protein
MLHLPVATPRVGFILPCRSSWRSPPFLPPLCSPCSTSRLFSTRSYAVAEPQPSEKLLAHPRVSIDRCCTHGPNRCAAQFLRRGLLPITGRPRPRIDRTDNPLASHRRGAPPRLVSLPPCSPDSATTGGSPSPECATVEDHTPMSFLAQCTPNRIPALPTRSSTHSPLPSPPATAGIGRPPLLNATPLSLEQASAREWPSLSGCAGLRPIVAH